MAKSRQGGAFGFLRKSIGSVTYSTLKDGKGKRIQVARSKPTEVANPNTVAQILQRMKIQPASRFYSAFEEILSNAFEGISYGPASRREFMRLALSQTGPYIPKGATRFIPAKYPVSEGSQAGMLVEFMTSANSEVGLSGEKGIVARFVDDVETFGIGKTLSEMAQLAFGRDVQLTFMCVTQNADGTFEPKYGRVLTADYTEDAATFLSFNGFTVIQSGNGVYMCNGVVANNTPAADFKAAFHAVVAAAVIVSYKQNETWLRSNADMVISDALEINLYGQEAMAAAIESYQSAQGVNSLNSSWYLNLANNQPFYGQLRNMNYTLEFDGAGGTVIQREVVIPIGYVVNENGALRAQIPADASGNLIVLSNGSYTTMADPSDGAAEGAKVKVSDVYLQITGTPTTYLWKEAYALQIQA